MALQRCRCRLEPGELVTVVEVRSKTVLIGLMRALVDGQVCWVADVRQRIRLFVGVVSVELVNLVEPLERSVQSVLGRSLFRRKRGLGCIRWERNMDRQ